MGGGRVFAVLARPDELIQFMMVYFFMNKNCICGLNYFMLYCGCRNFLFFFV